MLDPFPSIPPPEVRAAVAAAADVPRLLAATGRELHFELDRGTGKPRVEIHDLSGNVLCRISGAAALEIATQNSASCPGTKFPS